MVLLKRGNRKEKEIADLLKLKPANFSRKMKADAFTDEEMNRIAAFLGCTWTVEHDEYFTLDTGERI
jgi:cytochrome c1